MLMVDHRVTGNTSKHLLCLPVCYLLMVNGCRACCCLGMPMMLGDDRLGLPMLPLLPPPPPPLSPPTPIPLVCPVGPPTCWLWFSTLRLLMGRMPLHGHTEAQMMHMMMQRKWKMSSCHRDSEVVCDDFVQIEKTKVGVLICRL